MGTTSQKLTYLNDTKQGLKTVINYTGANITNDTTFRNYVEKLYGGYIDALNNPNTLFNNMPHITGTGTSITLNNTVECKMAIELEPSELSQDNTPTPSNPQDVHVITGDNTIKVCSKNFLNIEDILQNATDVIKNNDGSYTFTTTNAMYSTTVPIIYIDNEQLTVSYKITNNTGKNFRLRWVYADGTISNLSGSGSGTSEVSISNTSDSISTHGKVVGFRADWSTAGTFTIKEVMANAGTTALPYEPYQGQNLPLTLGDLEYCKIGSYADEFYKATSSDTSLQEEKWYLKKNIGKTILNGSEYWQQSNSMTGGDYFGAYTTDVHWGNAGTFENKNSFIINNFLTNDTTYGDYQFISSTGYACYLKILNTIVNSAENLETWLSNNNALIYHRLLTPTYTLLNDTLQTELDNIHEYVKSYESQTNVNQTNDDLPFVMKATSIKNYDSTLN